MSALKRDREWDASASSGDSSAPVTDTDSKRPRISSPTSALSSDGVSFSHRPVLASEQSSQAHPMAILDGIRAKLQSTSDPHLQARLLLQYSSAAASPGAKTAAAIDFLFSFLQQNQTTQSDGNQTKDPGSSGAIVVGAIVRGLRQLLAVKAAVVEPMIQVDAMGEQLMQCMSVGEDFKLRRDMLRIVVDCLMLTKKYKQVETLLHTCVQDHDAGMQAICLRGYLRLHDAGRCFTAETAATQDTAVDHFDRLVGFVLFAQSEEVRVLAAQVIVALTDQHPRSEVENSNDNKTPLFLPEKAFYVLCMAGNDASEAVRVEVARCLRRFSRVLASDIVEHAVVKTQIDEAVVDVAPEAVEMNTRRMMSSGVLLSLLEEIDVDVAAEASRTIAGLSEMSTTPDANTARWSQRALERAITAHFDVLPRASTSQLRQVLVSSLRRLLVCRHKLETKTDVAISSADLSSLLRSAVSDADSAKASVVEILLVLQHCDLSSTWAVQRLADFVLETAASTSFESYSVDSDETTWTTGRNMRDLGKKSSSVLKADVALTDRVRQETSQRSDQRHLVKSACQALLAHVDSSNGDNLDATSKSPSGSSLFFLKTSPSASCGTGSHTPADELYECPANAPHRRKHRCVSQSGKLPNPPLRILLRSLTCSVFGPRSSDCELHLLRMNLTFPSDLLMSCSSTPARTFVSDASARLPDTTQVCIHVGNAQHKSKCELWTHQQLPRDGDLASAIYVRAFALSSSPRAELLQVFVIIFCWKRVVLLGLITPFLCDLS
ncbi:Armadillo-type fold [Phytophthora cactorum]|nr:Armadillo-type fold [Phytophthora cactorum]